MTVAVDFGPRNRSPSTNRVASATLDPRAHSLDRADRGCKCPQEANGEWRLSHWSSVADATPGPTHTQPVDLGQTSVRGYLQASLRDGHGLGNAYDRQYTDGSALIENVQTPGHGSLCAPLRFPTKA